MRLDFSNSEQLIAFLLSVVLGVSFSLIYDLVRFWHFSFKCPKIAIFIVDILYFIIIGVLSFCFLLIYCKGMLRFYVFLGEILGFIMARLTVSKIFLYFLKSLKKAIDFFVNLLKKPLFLIREKLLQFLVKPLNKNAQNLIIKNKSRKCTKNHKKHKKVSKKP